MPDEIGPLPVEMRLALTVTPVMTLFDAIRPSGNVAWPLPLRIESPLASVAEETRFPSIVTPETLLEDPPFAKSSADLNARGQRAGHGVALQENIAYLIGIRMAEREDTRIKGGGSVRSGEHHDSLTAQTCVGAIQGDRVIDDLYVPTANFHSLDFLRWQFRCLDR